VEEVLQTIEVVTGYIYLFQKAVPNLVEAETDISLVLSVLQGMAPVVQLLQTLSGSVNLPSAGAPRAHYEQLSESLREAEATLNGEGGTVDYAAALEDVRRNSRPSFLRNVQMSAYFVALSGAAAAARLVEGSLPTEQIDSLQGFLGSLPEGEMDQLDESIWALQSTTEIVTNLDEEVAELRGHIAEAQEMISQAGSALTELNHAVVIANGYLEEIPSAFHPQQISATAQKVKQTIYTADDVVQVTMAVIGIIMLTLVTGILFSLVVHIPWVMALLTCLLAFMVLVSFAIAMAHGAAATISSTGCVSFEGYMYGFVDDISNSSEVAIALLDHYFYSADISLVRQFLVKETGINITEVMNSLEEAMASLEELQVQVANPDIVLQEPLKTMLIDETVGALKELYDTVMNLLELVSFDVVHNLYVSAKSTICCDLIRNSKQKWTLLITAGFLMGFIVLLLIAYIKLTDELNPDGMFCQCKVYYPLCPSKWRGREDGGKGSGEAQPAEQTLPQAPEVVAKDSEMKTGSNSSCATPPPMPLPFPLLAGPRSADKCIDLDTSSIQLVEQPPNVLAASPGVASDEPFAGSHGPGAWPAQEQERAVLGQNWAEAPDESLATGQEPGVRLPPEEGRDSLALSEAEAVEQPSTGGKDPGLDRPTEDGSARLAAGEGGDMDAPSAYDARATGVGPTPTQQEGSVSLAASNADPPRPPPPPPQDQQL